MSDGREYKLKRRESLIWRYGGSPVIDWEYSNSYGTPYFVPINAVLGSFYTSTCQMLGHSLLYERKVTTYDESETGVTDTEHYSYLSGNRMQWKERKAWGPASGDQLGISGYRSNWYNPGYCSQNGGKAHT